MRIHEAILKGAPALALVGVPGGFVSQTRDGRLRGDYLFAALVGQYEAHASDTIGRMLALGTSPVVVDGWINHHLLRAWPALGAQCPKALRPLAALAQVPPAGDGKDPSLFAVIAAAAGTVTMDDLVEALERANV